MRRKIIWTLLISSFTFAVVGVTLGWFLLFGNQPKTNSGLEMVRQIRVKTLAVSSEPRDALISDEFLAALDALESKCENVYQEAQETSDRLRQADPHLDAMLQNVQAPFTSDDTKYVRDAVSSAQALFNESSSRIVFAKNVSEKEATEIRQAVDGILAAIVSGTWDTDKETERVLMAFEQGNDDPLLLISLLYRIKPDPERCKQIAFKAYERRQIRKLKPIESILLYNVLQDMSHNFSPEQIAKLTEEMFAEIKLAANWGVSEKIDVGQQRFLFGFLMDMAKSMTYPAACELLTVLNDSKDPCQFEALSQIVAYHVCHELAWSYRGHGAIHEVNDDNLGKYEKYAQQSAKHALRAWTVSPHLYHIFEPLITVQTEIGGTGIKTVTWFRHCLAQAADHGPVYRTMEWSLMGRWGGTASQRLWFVEHCVECDLTKSSIFFGHGSLFTTYLGEEVGILSRPTWPRAVKIAHAAVANLRAYSDTEPHPSATPDNLSAVSRVLWRTGSFKELHWLMNVYPHCVPDPLIVLERTSVNDLKSLTQYAVKSEKDGWKQVRDVLMSNSQPSTKHVTGLPQVIQELIKEDESDSERKSYLEGLAGQADLLNRYLAGETIRFSREDLEHWVRVVPDQCSLSFVDVPEVFYEAPQPSEDQSPESRFPVIVEKGSCAGFQYKCPASNTKLVMMAPFHIVPPYRLQIDVNCSADTEGVMDPWGVMVVCGARIQQDPERNSSSPIYLLCLAEKYIARDLLPLCAWQLGSPSYRGTRLPFAKMRQFAVEVFGDGFNARINHLPWESKVAPVSTLGWLQLGRYTPGFVPGTPETEVTYTISNIQLQRLDMDSVTESEDYKGFQQALAKSKSQEADSDTSQEESAGENE